MKHLKYLCYVLRHKWFVLIECCKLGISWRGIVHDLSKFTPTEWFPYVEKFYGDRPSPRDATGAYDPLSVGGLFDRAWLHHQHYNDHHWQWWILRGDVPRDKFLFQSPGDGYSPVKLYSKDEERVIAEFPFDGWSIEKDFAANDLAKLCIAGMGIKVLEMPIDARKEMLADWRGAGRAQGKPDTVAWYHANRNKILLGDETRAWIEEHLGYRR